MKKLISLFIALALAITALTGAAFAEEAANNTTPSASSGYVLQDSTVDPSSMFDNYKIYNCYAYALQKTDKRYEPGDIKNGENNNFSMALSLKEMVRLVKDDLETLGYQCVGASTVRPSSSDLAPGATAICIRRGDSDFHFMRLVGNQWYHKPGSSQVLIYKHLPSDSLTWTNEGVDENGPYQGLLTYTSTIYYIIYGNTHTTAYKYMGKSYHSGGYHYYLYADVCTVCGHSENEVWERTACSGPPCIEPASSTEVQ